MVSKFENILRILLNICIWYLLKNKHWFQWNISFVNAAWAYQTIFGEEALEELQLEEDDEKDPINSARSDNDEIEENDMKSVGSDQIEYGKSTCGLNLQCISSFQCKNADLCL